MPSPKEVLERLLPATLKWGEDAVAALYTDADRETLADDAADKILVAFSEHIESVRKETAEEQFKFGERKAHKDWRDTVKALGVKSDKKDPKDVLSELMNVKGSPEVNDDVVKKHPAYLGLEQEFLGLKNGMEQTIQEKLAAKDAEHQRERTNAQVRDMARKFLLELKPILPKDPKKAEAQIQPYLDKVISYNYQPLEGNAESPFLLLDNEGKRLNDKLGHPVKPIDKFRELAEERFDFETAEKRTSAGDPGNGAVKGADKLELPADPTLKAKMLFELQTDPTATQEKVAEVLKMATAK